MAFPTTPEETLKYYLFKVMSEEDATRFMNLKEALAACEEQEPKWQAVYALSVHVYVLNSYRTRTEFRDYINEQVAEINNAEKLWVIGGKFVPKLSGHESYWFFLYLLYMGQLGICSNQEKESEEFLKHAISKEMDSKRYPFIGYGKLMAANMLIPILMKEGNYGDAIGAVTKVAECLPTEDVFTQLDELVDKWLFYLENIPIEQYTQKLEPGAVPEGSPEEQLAKLLDSIEGICATSISSQSKYLDEATNWNSTMCKLNKTFRQYWAWKFGNIVGHLSKVDVVRNSLLVMCAWGYNSWPNGTVITSLIINYNADTIWPDYLDYLFSMFLFHSTSGDEDLYITNASPINDLYWAMRIGFVDAMYGKALAIVPQTPPVEKIEKIEKIETIVTSTALRQIKGFEEMRGLLQAVAGRMPPKPDEIESFLEDTLSPNIFGRLPLEVADSLLKAELELQSRIERSHSKIDFAKSVEAALDCLFISPLRGYYKEHKLGWPFMSPSPHGSKNHYGIRQWGEYFCELAQQVGQQLDTGNTLSINPFLKQHYPNLDYCELEGLGKSLQDVQKLRGGSAHYQRQFSRTEEIAQLKELREMVLGLEGHPSIIRQMVDLFGNRPPNLLPG